MSFFRISEFINDFPLPEGEILPIEAYGQSIILYLKNNQLFAFAAKCPHGGTLLSAGYVDDKNCIVCPTHFYKFQLTTGREVLGREYRLKTYKTLFQEGEWYVEV